MQKDGFRYLFGQLAIVFYMILLAACGGSETESISNGPPSQPPTEPPIQYGRNSLTLMHQNEQRSYIQYVPTTYDGSQAVPLVFNFHGRNGKMDDFFDDVRMDLVSDSAGFILITPQATRVDGEFFWVSNASSDPAVADDVGFVSSLIDDVSNRYNIDANRVYSVGGSNGGIFSFALACRLSERIAAAVSIIGPMNGTQLNQCSPTRTLPILQIHGTEDDKVSYGTVQLAINFWVDFNQTSLTPVRTELPDTDPNDGSRVVHFVYDNGINQTRVEHFQIIGGGHDWPGVSGNMDINGSEEAWKFVSGFALDGSVINN